MITNALRFALSLTLVSCSLARVAAQTTTLASVASDGTQADEQINHHALSGDGRWVYFFTGATTLVPGDTNNTWDGFIHDRETGALEPVTVDSNWNWGNGPALEGSVSDDGRYVAFASAATNLVPNDTNGQADIFVRDRLTATTELISVSTSGVQTNVYCREPVISSDGRWVAFESFSSNLVPGTTSLALRIYLRDRQKGVTTCVSVDSNGVPSNSMSSRAALSGDGRFVVFESLATNLLPCCDDNNNNYDIYLHDNLNAMTWRLSNGPNVVQADGDSYNPDISRDGRTVVFESNAPNLVAVDTNGQRDVFVHDVLTGINQIVSVDSNGVQANLSAGGASISGDGRFIAFASAATNLVPNDTNGTVTDIFIHDAQSGATTLGSFGYSGGQSNMQCGEGVLNFDGRYLAFITLSDNLVPVDTNGMPDSFLRDRGEFLPGWSTFCFGNGSLATDCPCGNFGGGVHGCGNSVNTLGARLVPSGSVLADPFTGTDTVLLSASGMPSDSASIYLQGDASIPAGVVFGDGVRCAGGHLVRLALKPCVAGASQFPESGDPSLSEQGGALLGSGVPYYYQTYYRNPDPTFCPAPPGNTWNVTGGVKIVW